MLALEVVGGRIPVIHDVHDLQSLRRTPYEDGFDDPDDPAELESAAIEGCAALVAVSREMLDEIDARHATPARRLLFANYALARDLAPARAPARRRGGPAARRLPGEPVGQRQPLRPARALRGDRGGRHRDRRLPQPRRARRTASWPARTPGLRVMDTPGAGRAPAGAAGLRRSAGRPSTPG